MLFRRDKEKTAMEYRTKMEKINRQIADLEKLADKYQACSRSSARK